MRVRFSHHIFRIEPYGGVSRYIAELHAGLLGRGIDSRVIAPLHANGFLRGAEAVTGIDVSWMHPRAVRQGMAKVVDEVWTKVAWSRLGRDDIVHMTYFDTRLPRRGHLVTTVYDMVHELFPETIGRRDTTLETKRRTCEAADMVLTISDRTRNDLLERYQLRPDRVVVTPLGVRPVSRAGADDAVSLPTVPYLLYVGDRRRRYKNFAGFVDAYARCSVRGEVGLVCFGGGPFSPQEDALLSAAGVRSTTTQMQGDDVALAACYRSATGLVYPSLYEGFGLPPLEAMTYGCPVAAAFAGAIPEVAGSAALLFDPADGEAMTDAIDRIVADADLRRTLVVRGHERVGEYTWDRTVERTIAAYEDVLEEPAMRQP